MLNLPVIHAGAPDALMQSQAMHTAGASDDGARSSVMRKQAQPLSARRQQQQQLPKSPRQQRKGQQMQQQLQQHQLQRHQQHRQLTNSEIFEQRERQLRDRREEVTWETSSYDPGRGRMVRSLNVVERNRLQETHRQIQREKDQRMRDICQEQTAVLTVRSVASSRDLRVRGRQDLGQLLLFSSEGSRSHSGGTVRFF